MASTDMMKKLKLNPAELQSRRAFFEIADEDLERLATLRPFAEKHADVVVDELYELIIGHEGSRAFFPDEATLRRVKRLQKEYFLGIFSGACDLAYVEGRLKVGAAHERIGLQPKWYLGAYARYMRILLAKLFADNFAAEAAYAAFNSIQKMVFFDVSLAIDTYIFTNVETISRHQAAIRELSTPVIRVHDRVLLLPVVGTIDSHRAQQIMETVLTRVVDDQAKAVIIDIAGVAVVDTRVADHLLKTTAAVRLLGATTILTGISAQVARTVIHLGVDISGMETSSSLAEGIELALSLVGKRITNRAPRRRAVSSRRRDEEADRSSRDDDGDEDR